MAKEGHQGLVVGFNPEAWHAVQVCTEPVTRPCDANGLLFNDGIALFGGGNGTGFLREA